MILAGDIGGTNTRLALFDASTLAPLPGSIIKYPSGQFKRLEDILGRYLADVPMLAGLKPGKKLKLRAAGFGVAGPVRDGKVKTTNLPWLLDAKKLSKTLGVRSTALVNDLYATAAGIEVLPKKSLHTLRKGKPTRTGGTRAVIAPGTGLGHASIIHVANPDVPDVINPAEAGHCDFAPTSDLESRLRAHIASIDDPTRGFFKRCSYENVLSGPGLRNIYDFLTTVEKRKPNKDVAAAELKDRAGVISMAGLAGSCPTCAEALELFVSILGRQAGNFALSVLALDGIYLGGGIPPKILDALKRPAFLAALNDKGSQKWIAEVPVHVITDDLCALYGAANCGRRE